MAAKTILSAFTASLTLTSYVLAIGESRFTPFALVTEVVQGNASFKDLTVSLMRWGPSDYSPSLDFVPYNGSNQNRSLFILNDTHINLAGYPIIGEDTVIPVYGLDLVNETYYFIHGPSDANLAMSIQWHTANDSPYSEGMPGFCIDVDGFLSYNGDVPFEAFTACGGLYGSVCPESCSGWVTTLSWRNTTSVPDLVNCADVKLRAA